MGKSFTPVEKKDDKNAKTSHNELHRNSGKKATLFGNRTSRSHANNELIEDSLLREPLEDNRSFKYR